MGNAPRLDRGIFPTSVIVYRGSFLWPFSFFSSFFSFDLREQDTIKELPTVTLQYTRAYSCRLY